MSTENFETGERAFHELLREARVLRATSFHLNPVQGHATVRFRTDGEMGPARSLSDPDRRSLLDAAMRTSRSCEPRTTPSTSFTAG